MSLRPSHVAYTDSTGVTRYQFPITRAYRTPSDKEKTDLLTNVRSVAGVFKVGGGEKISMIYLMRTNSVTLNFEKDLEQYAKMLLNSKIGDYELGYNKVWTEGSHVYYAVYVSNAPAVVTSSPFITCTHVWNADPNE